MDPATQMAFIAGSIMSPAQECVQCAAQSFTQNDVYSGLLGLAAAAVVILVIRFMERQTE